MNVDPETVCLKLLIIGLVVPAYCPSLISVSIIFLQFQAFHLKSRL